MSVTLWTQPTVNYPGGFARNYNSVDEALSQALTEIASESEPQPDRIIAEDGSTAYDQASLKAALQE